MTRTSAAGHPLHQAVSFLFLSFYCISSVFSLLFHNSVFLRFSFFIAFFVPVCNSCFTLPLFCFICLVQLTYFLHPFLKLFLFWLFFSWSLLPFLFFSELFLFFHLFLELFSKNLSLLLFISCFFFSFSVFFCLLSPVCSLFFCLHTFCEHRFFSESSSFKCVSFPCFFDSLFWSLCFDPFFWEIIIVVSVLLSPFFWSSFSFINFLFPPTKLFSLFHSVGLFVSFKTKNTFLFTMVVSSILTTFEIPFSVSGNSKRESWTKRIFWSVSKIKRRSCLKHKICGKATQLLGRGN